MTKRIETGHSTFSKKARRMIKENIPEAVRTVKKYVDYSLMVQIKDKNNKTLGYWTRMDGQGIIVVRML
jgi:hypothetical protein